MAYSDVVSERGNVIVTQVPSRRSKWLLKFAEVEVSTMILQTLCFQTRFTDVNHNNSTDTDKILLCIVIQLQKQEKPRRDTGDNLIPTTLHVVTNNSPQARARLQNADF